MSKVWTALMAFLRLVWYNIESAADSIRLQKTLREAAEKRTAELEARKAATDKAAHERDVSDGSKIVDPGAAGEFLRSSFPRPRDP